MRVLSSIDADNEFSFFSGYLGIGTDNPERKLHIKDDRIKISHSSSSPGVELVDDSDGDQFNLYHHRADDRFLITDKNDAKLLSLTKGGKLGIGIYTPGEALDIDGNMKINQDIIGSSLILDLDAGTNPKKITSNQVGGTSTLELQMRKQIKDLGLNPDELGFSRANRDKIAEQITSDNQPLSLR